MSKKTYTNGASAYALIGNGVLQIMEEGNAWDTSIFLAPIFGEVDQETFLAEALTLVTPVSGVRGVSLKADPVAIKRLAATHGASIRLARL